MAKRGLLIPRGEKRWLVRVYLGRDQEGRRQYAAKTVEGTAKEARRELTKMQRDSDTKTLAPSATRTPSCIRRSNGRGRRAGHRVALRVLHGDLHGRADHRARCHRARLHREGQLRRWVYAPRTSRFAASARRNYHAAAEAEKQTHEASDAGPRKDGLAYVRTEGPRTQAPVVRKRRPDLCVDCGVDSGARRVAR